MHDNCNCPGRLGWWLSSNNIHLTLRLSFVFCLLSFVFRFHFHVGKTLVYKPPLLSLPPSSSLSSALPSPSFVIIVVIIVIIVIIVIVVIIVTVVIIVMVRMLKVGAYRNQNDAMKVTMTQHPSISTSLWTAVFAKMDEFLEEKTKRPPFGLFLKTHPHFWQIQVTLT